MTDSGRPLDRSAKQLPAAWAADLLEDEDLMMKWAAQVLDRQPSGFELTRARVMLKARVRETAPQLPTVAPKPRTRPPELPCGRCRRLLPLVWEAGTWVRPPACDGFSCGFLGHAEPELPEGPEDLVDLELDLVREVWAWKDADPPYARRFAQILGTMQLQREALEAIAADADPASERIARDALRLHDGSIPRMLPAPVPDFELEDLEDAGEPDKVRTLAEKVVSAARRHAAHSPFARRILEEEG